MTGSTHTTLVVYGSDTIKRFNGKRCVGLSLIQREKTKGKTLFYILRDLIHKRFLEKF